MDHLPKKRMRGLQQVLAKAFGESEPQELGLRDRILHQALGKTEAQSQYGSFDLNEDTLSRIARIAEEKASAADLLAELLALSTTERELVVAVEPRFQIYSLASHTLQQCGKAVFHDPVTARELARLAHIISEQVDPRTCGGTAALADLQAYSLAMEGNAFRVSGDLDSALKLFAEARRIQEKGGADPDLAARIDHLEASLRRELRQYDTALRLLDRARKTFSALQDHDQKARTIINRSNVFLVKGDFDEAIATLRGALDSTSSPELAWTLRHNLVEILALSGRPREAAELFEETRPFYREHTDPLTACRRIWMEGLIARELGEDLDRAAELLKEAATRLAEHGYSLDAALAGLDLVAVYAKQGQNAEVLQVASDLIQLFRTCKAHPEALAAFILVHQAAEKQAVNLSLLSQAASRVKRASGTYEMAAS
jgi:tetratricopeptide (TPR) repeat protein